MHLSRHKSLGLKIYKISLRGDPYTLSTYQYLKQNSFRALLRTFTELQAQTYNIKTRLGGVRQALAVVQRMGDARRTQ